MIIARCGRKLLAILKQLAVAGELFDVSTTVQVLYRTDDIKVLLESERTRGKKKPSIDTVRSKKCNITARFFIRVFSAMNDGHQTSDSFLPTAPLIKTAPDDDEEE